jgi:Mor family transcriptional regulator
MACISKPELIKLQKTLKTDAAIGEKFRISRQAVHQLRAKYGINANLAKNKERNEKIKVLYKKGKTGISIAKQLDMSISQVYRIIKRKA